MKNKNSKARMQVIFGVLLFTLVFMIELYGMLNYPDMFIILAVIAGVDLIFLFVVIDGLMELSDQKKARQEEQYDSVFKSEKASYLMLKKYFEEIEDKLNYLEQAAKVPTEEIVNAQKGIAKVIINRNHENMEALMNAYDQLLEEIEQFKDNLGETETIAKDYKDELLASQKSHELETEKALQIKMQDLTVVLKDMELRLNNAMMQSQRVIAQAPMMTAPMPTYAPQPEAFKAEPEPEINSQAEPQTVEAEPEAEPEVEPKAEIKSEPEVETKPEPEAETKPEPEAETKLEPEAETKPEPEKSPVEEEKPPMPDLSDPNKTMSPDEIAALFANMGGGNEPAASEEPKEEPKAVEAEPEPEPEKSPVQEEKPPMPDLSDPNKTLSPDEIAALFANMGA